MGWVPVFSNGENLQDHPTRVKLLKFQFTDQNIDTNDGHGKKKQCKMALL
jgi:hypothetical protein